MAGTVLVRALSIVKVRSSIAFTGAGVSIRLPFVSVMNRDFCSYFIIKI